MRAAHDRGMSMTEKTLPQNSPLPSEKHLSFLWRTADSDWFLVKRAIFDGLINKIVRLAQKFLGGWYSWKKC